MKEKPASKQATKSRQQIQRDLNTKKNKKKQNGSTMFEVGKLAGSNEITLFTNNNI